MAHDGSRFAAGETLPCSSRPVQILATPLTGHCRADDHAHAQASGSTVSNLMAAFAALPAPDPLEGHAAAQAADARISARNGGAAWPAVPPPFTSVVRSWTPDIPAGTLLGWLDQALNTCI